MESDYDFHYIWLVFGYILCKYAINIVFDK